MNSLSKSAAPLLAWKKVRRDLLTKTFSSALPLDIEGEVAYVEAQVGSKQNTKSHWFLLDTGTTHSTVDGPLLGIDAPLANTAQGHEVSPEYTPEVFQFFGEWNHPSFSLNDYSNIRASVRQAGIIGTDFMSDHVHLLDLIEKKIYRADAKAPYLIQDLKDAGLTPLSTYGYFTQKKSARLRDRNGIVPNVPTIPIQIGSKTFVAQIDSGYNDSKYPFSVNINEALKNELDQAGIFLQAEPSLNSSLSTCVVGVKDQTEAYRLPSQTFFSFLNLDGKSVNQYPDVYLFLKKTPDAAKICGGISTWKIPAAQLGASFFKQMGLVIFDPLTSVVWIPETEPS